MSPEQRVETARNIEVMTGGQIVEAYLKGEVMSNQVMRRCLEMIGRDHLADETLFFHGVKVINSDGRAARIEDYIDHAQDHGHAVPVILAFIQQEPDEENPRFIASRELVAGFVDEHMTNASGEKK